MTGVRHAIGIVAFGGRSFSKTTYPRPTVPPASPESRLDGTWTPAKGVICSVVSQSPSFAHPECVAGEYSYCKYFVNVFDQYSYYIRVWGTG